MRLSDFGALCVAEWFATELGRHLTALLTVSWRYAPGFDSADRGSWSDFQDDFQTKMERWLERRGVPVAFVWVREMHEKKKGGSWPHTHYLVHIPLGCWEELSEPLRLFLHNAGGFTHRDGVDIEQTYDAPGARIPALRKGQLLYLGKGLAPADAEPLGIKAEPHAPLPCKRVGWSETIGETARKGAGHRPVADTADTAALRAYLELGELFVIRREMQVQRRARRETAPPTPRPPGSIETRINQIADETPR
jgi:hypothetical protein